MSDAQLLFECLTRWGEEACDRLVGEFAFAFWDSERQRLMLARDILGFRPLHFHQQSNFVAFATMPSGLHALHGVPYGFDAEFLKDSLALLPRKGRRTNFIGIERVEPAHFVWLEQGSCLAHQYWKPRRIGKAGGMMDHEIGLRKVLDEAVRSQLRGAGSVIGTHLSAGLDSSIVTTSAAGQCLEGSIVAFTAVPQSAFKGPTPSGTFADESWLAALTASKMPNIEHVRIDGGNLSPLAGMSADFHYQQQPGDNLCNAVWGRAIHREANSRGIKVLLIGSAGNMTVTYSGLETLPWLLQRFRLLKLALLWLQLLRNGMRLHLIAIRTVGPFMPVYLWVLLSRLTGRAVTLNSYSAVDGKDLTDLKQKSADRGLDIYYRPRRDPFDTKCWALSRNDGGNYHKGILAEWGVSVRDPMADKRVIEYCLAVPNEEFIKGGLPRSLAIRSFSSRLPFRVINSRKRGYQSADWSVALRADLKSAKREVAALRNLPEGGSILSADWLDVTIETFPLHDPTSDADVLRYRWGFLRGISTAYFMRRVRGTNSGTV